MEAAMTASSAAGEGEPLLLERREGGVAYLMLNRPAQYNALSEQMLAALHAAFESLAADSAVRAVVLGGEGRAFCAGHDLKQMQANRSLGYYQRLFDDCSRLMMRIQTLPQPVIARVHGVATAAGCQLVAMCDLAIAAEDARFAVSGINVGLFCATPSVALTRNVGRKAAGLDAQIDVLAAAITAKPRSVIAAGKALFYRQIELGAVRAYELAGQA